MLQSKNNNLIGLKKHSGISPTSLTIKNYKKISLELKLILIIFVLTEEHVNAKKLNSGVSIFIIIVLIFAIQSGSIEHVLFIANQLKNDYWGIYTYFKFLSFCTIRGKKIYDTLDLDSKEFQNFLQDQYAMFRKRESVIFPKITDICKMILYHQLDDHTFLQQTSEHMAMAVIRTLNNNFISDNTMNIEQVNKEFNEIYLNVGFVPRNIFTILVDQKLLIEENNNYKYYNIAVYNYFRYTSKDLAPIIKTDSNQIKKEITNREMISNFIDLETKERFYAHTNLEELRNHEEFYILNNLIQNWNDSHQYFVFKDEKVQSIFNEICITKIMQNDFLFHSLLTNVIGLGVYYYDPKCELDNILYFLQK